MKFRSALVLAMLGLIISAACAMRELEKSVAPLSTPEIQAENDPVDAELMSDTPMDEPQVKTETPLPPAQTNSVEQETVREIDAMEMIEIPQGEVWIGCDESNNAGFACMADELPLHQVFVDRFLIDKYEVSNAQFALCVQDGVCETPYYQRSATRQDYYANPDFSDYPRVAVSWFEAQAYCQWAGGRLPTEAEWVRAARGDDKRVYPWGDELPTCDLANTLDEKTGHLCVGDTARVGSYPLGASPFGVMDLAGNVWEWNADWYHKDYYSFSPRENPQGPEMGATRVVHGGGFDYGWERLRIAYTSDHDPREHKIGFGFRCVMDSFEGN
jgi:formylglycine-generating enzyme required for sulfatase activity